jgi:hypothetical protein
MDDTDTLSRSLDAWLVHRDLAQAELLLNRLFETAAASFNNPRILQYMVYVLGASQRYDECEMAMRAYIQLSLHAYKTAGVVDQHFQTTVHYAITIFANAHRKGRAKPGLAPEFAEAVQPIQKNAHLLGRAMFALCCEGNRSWGTCIDLLEPSYDLVLALMDL